MKWMIRIYAIWPPLADEDDQECDAGVVAVVDVDWNRRHRDLARVLPTDDAN